MIISLFGPDGVGKTMAAQTLGAEMGVPVMHGSSPRTWRDTSWYDGYDARGIDPNSINDPMFFYELVTRAHREAMTIEDDAGAVIIDSDPFHKVFIHDYINGRIATDALDSHVRRLLMLANHDADREWRHLHMRLSQHGTPVDHAVEMQRRIHARGDVSPYDPQTVDESLAMMHASDILFQQLGAAGQALSVGYSDHPDIYA